jgi:hypothetical protein
MSDAATSRQNHHQIGRQLLFAALCFGPPLAFFVWVGIRYFDWTVLFIPVGAVIVAVAVYGLAKDLPVSRHPSTHDRSPAVGVPIATSTEPVSSSATKPDRGYLVADSILGVCFFTATVLVLSHIGGHDPGEHGILPIAVQAILAVVTIGGLGWLFFRRLVNRIRSRNEGS